MYILGLKIFRKERGIAIATAIIEMFVSVVSFRIAFSEIARARVITKKNQIRITVFHLYFIRMKISAKARAKENMRDRKVGVGSSSGASSPNGRLPRLKLISPVVSLIVEVGA